MALVVKNPPANAGDASDTDSAPGWGRSPGEGNGYPLQCSFVENWSLVDCSPWGHKESDTAEHACGAPHPY